MLFAHSQSNFRKLVAVAISLTCAAALAVGGTIWWLRVDEIADVYKDADNLAVVLADQISNSVKAIDLVLTEIKDREEMRAAQTPDDFDRALHDHDTYKFLVDRLSQLQQAAFITLVDKNGKLANTTQQRLAPEIDLSDRAHFHHLKNNNDNKLLISDALVDRIRGTDVVLLSRRINGVDKSTFVGEVLVAVNLSYFRRIYKSIASLDDEMFVLYHRDGTVIVGAPDRLIRAEQKVPEASPWYRLVQEGGGTYRAVGPIDGEARLMAVRPVGDYPLVVSVGPTEAAALATWRIQALVLGIGTFLAMLCSTFLLKALNAQFDNLARSKATIVQQKNELESVNTQLMDAQAQINAAFDNMSQGLVMLDPSARIVVYNKRYLEMYGLLPENLKPGCSLREILNHRVATGTYRAEDVERDLTDVLAAVEQRRVLIKTIKLPDGRITRLLNHPIEGGGWVSTHEDITAEARAEERIAYAARFDALTGLPNRTVFCEQLEHELMRLQRGERFAVLYLDICNLKQINDTLGHSSGDKLLRGVADRLSTCIKDIDIVARLGSDEFAVIRKLFDRPSDAAALAKRVRDTIREPFDLDGHQIAADVSIGITVAPMDACETNELLKAADIARHEAKKSGCGTYCFYEPEMNARLQARSKLEQDLQRALANSEFELVYQPIASLEDDEITSFEALLRWNHPERGRILPAEFVPVAEDIGLIVPLGEWVVRAACVEAATWPNHIRVSVNISSIQLTSNNLTNAVVGALSSAGIPPNRLELEITESALLENTLVNLATLRDLHDLGVRFAMDDFGTGHSSLRYLLSFPLHRIKIDKCFIAALSDKNESHAIIRSVADLARSLKLQVTAEGVETALQLQQVRLLGCTEMQGNLLSPPRSAAEISRFFISGAERAGNLIAINASTDIKKAKMCGIRPDLVCSHRLTGRECDVLMGILSGDSSKQSARHLNISPRTIELHRGRIMKKFGVKNSADLVRVMLTTGCSPLGSEAALRYLG